MRLAGSVAVRFLVFAFALTLLQAGFNPETGTFAFQHYSPRDYGASPQNWSLAQDPRGVMYFGNTDGLLEFDGINWRTLRLPNRSIVRSVSVGSAGGDGKWTVYVGGQRDFGYLQPDSAGVMQFVSLLGRVAESDKQFADVWKILPTPQGVYFSTYSRLFRLEKDGTVRAWPAEKKFGRAFYVFDTVYVQTAGKGLLRVSGDELVPVPGGQRFSSEVINAAVEFDGGALIGSTTHLYRLSREGVEPFSSAADAELAKGSIYSMQVLPGGEIAVGTRTAGLFLLDRTGEIQRVISKASDGLSDDWVSAIYADRQGGVWLAQLSGLTRFNPGLSRFSAKSNLDTDVECISRFAGSVYAGTSAGLFRMTTSPRTGPKFEQVEGFTNAVWALTPHGNMLMAATDAGIFGISGLKSNRIFESTRTVWDLVSSRLDESVIYAARRTSVVKLRALGSGWETAVDFEQPGEEFRSVLEDKDGAVWAASKGKIWRLRFRASTVDAEQWDAARGVPAGWINIHRLDGHVVFATTKGLKQFDAKTNQFVRDDTLGSRYADGSRDVFNLYDDPSGNLWVTGEGYHDLLIYHGGSYKRLPAPLLRSGIQEIYGMSIDEDGTAWAVGSDYILHRWDRRLAGDPDRDFNVLTRRVQVIGSKSSLYGGNGSLDELRLPWRDNKLTFEFAAPFYEEPKAVEYQVKVDGTDTDWSAWSHDTKKDYNYFPEGSYQLRVRARSPHGTITEKAAMAFHVLPPWYRTWWAYSFYLVLGGLFVWGVVGLRTRQLQEEKKQLEIIVEERTVEIRHQRDEIQVQERKSHSLLLNILPGSVADELKSTGAVQPVGFDDVTVCFTDFVGFTLSSETLAPAALVDALNEYFTAFDEIISRYGLEKLKTIGDSYMFASGLPTRRNSHAVDAVLAALEMVDVVKRLAARPGGMAWNIRIGLHSGPVVAGVVGIRKFAFDIWGNTVNFAARMESSGVPGSVNMSERTCQLQHELIDCEFRGKVRIKEGRELPMFLARGPAHELMDGPVINGVPEAFARKYRETFGEEPKSFPLRVQSPELAETAAVGGRTGGTD